LNADLVGTGVVSNTEFNRLNGITSDILQASQLGANNGIAELDSGGIILTSQLPPSWDIVKYASVSNFPTNGQSNLVYLALDTNKIYRWSGSTYVELSPQLSIGITAQTAGRGDRTNTAYLHSQLTSGNPHNVSKTDIDLGNVDNTADSDKPVSSDTQSALDGKLQAATG
jgi:hypothetical protein